MQKLKSSIIVIAVFFILPLLGNPALLLHWKVWALIICSLAIWFSQPSISTKEAGVNHKSDQHTVWIILALSGISVIAPLVQWAYLESSNNLLATLLGSALIIGGVSFRIWAIQTLGKCFTSIVKITDGHRVITTGPYAIVRHPSYLGAWLAIVGCGVFLGAFTGALIAAISMSVAYYFRITAEEQTLVEAFGDAYKDYQRNTKRIVPLVW